MVNFVDEHRGEHGVEPICAALQMAPSTYYARKAALRTPAARTVRDALMMQVLLALWVANRKVYGAEKLWRAARRAGDDVGRDQVARLMRHLGIRGVSRCRKKVFTTRLPVDFDSAASSPRPSARLASTSRTERQLTNPRSLVAPRRWCGRHPPQQPGGERLVGSAQLAMVDGDRPSRRLQRGRTLPVAPPGPGAFIVTVGLATQKFGDPGPDGALHQQTHPEAGHFLQRCSQISIGAG
jgi:hypothetical protein